MLNNITKNQISYLWIIAIIVIISILFNFDLWIKIVSGLVFVYSFMAIDMWNDATEKKQLKEEVKG